MAARLLRSDARSAGWLVAVLLCACCATCSSRGESMSDTFYRSVEEKIELSFPSSPLGPPRRGTIAAAPSHVPASERDGSYRQPYANERLNSRVGYRLPAGPWKVRWKAAIEPGTSPRFVLQAQDRVVVEGEMDWQLFHTQDGRSLDSGRFGLSHVAMNPEDASFWFITPSGYVELRRTDGALAQRCPIALPETYRRLAIARAPGSWTIVSLSPGPPVAPLEQWAIERVGVGDPHRIDEAKVLLAAARAGMLIRRVPDLLPPPRLGDTWVMASDDRIHLLDRELKVARAVAGEFRPTSVSIDDAGRLYLVAREGPGAFLSVIGEDGRRIAAFPLPAGAERPVQPPLVMGDHGAVVVGADSAWCFSPDGSIRWRRAHDAGPANGAIASLTADDRLLVADGDAVIAIEPEGEAHVLARVEGERLLTPPVLDYRGSVYVASEAFLYCLAPAAR